MSAASRSARSVVRSADPGLPQHRGRAPQHPDAGCLHIPQRRARLVARPGRRAIRGPRPRAPARGCPPTARPAGSPRRGSSPAAPASRRPPRLRVALPSRRSASAVTALAACLRNSPWWRGGSRNSAAGTHTASAIAQPSSRSSIGPGRRARGQHEGQQRGPLAGRDRLAEHTGEHDRHAEQEHQRDGQPRVRRHQGAQRDEDRAVDAQPRVGHGAGLPVAGKIRQHHQRERPEDREQRRLRIARDGEAHRGRQRDDDRRAHRAPQRVELGIALANPIDRPAQQRRPAR